MRIKKKIQKQRTRQKKEIRRIKGRKDRTQERGNTFECKYKCSGGKEREEK